MDRLNMVDATKVESEPFNLAEVWYSFFSSISESEPLAYYGALGVVFMVVVVFLKWQKREFYQLETMFYLTASAISLLFLPYFLLGLFVLLAFIFLLSSFNAFFNLVNHYLG